MSKQNRSRLFIFSTYGACATAVLVFVVLACTNTSAKAKPNLVFKDPPKAGVLAKIGDKEISEDELVGDAKLNFLDIKKKEYEFKMERLNALIQTTLLGEEARKANISVEEFINKKVVTGKLEPSQKEYDDFVKEKHITESQINPQLKERINAFLKEQKKDVQVQTYLAKLTKVKPIEVYFKKPKIQIAVETGGAPTWGDGDVTIVEFSDFQCPFCSRAAETMKELKKKYKGKVKVAFKHFPLSFHKEAKPTSEASMCVHEQGSDKFWKFYDAAFKGQSKLDTESLIKYAKESGADEAKFKTCFESKKYSEFVDKDIAYGEKLGVRSTPTFFVNGELLSGALPLDAFSESVDDALADLKK